MEIRGERLIVRRGRVLLVRVETQVSVVRAPSVRVSEREDHRLRIRRKRYRNGIRVGRRYAVVSDSGNQRGVRFPDSQTGPVRDLVHVADDVVPRACGNPASGLDVRQRSKRCGAIRYRQSEGACRKAYSESDAHSFGYVFEFFSKPVRSVFHGFCGRKSEVPYVRTIFGRLKNHLISGILTFIARK